VKVFYFFFQHSTKKEKKSGRKAETNRLAAVSCYSFAWWLLKRL